MTATNHVLTGIVIASSIHNPLLALPLAFLSHFAMDALPHYGNSAHKFSSYKFKLVLGADMYLAAMCLFMVLVVNPANLWVVLFGGVLAASPDLMWLPDFIAAQKGRPHPKYGPIRRFHARVQWHQKPNGLWLEVPWFIAAFFLAFTHTL